MSTTRNERGRRPEQPTVGFLHGGTPYLKLGQGPPLVMVLGLTPDHETLGGPERSMALRDAAPLAGDFTVWVVNRKRGLEPGESMSDIAGHLAAAIDHEIGEPVSLVGTSTGGSVVLQLAVDRPELVRRLVVVSAAYRLGPAGRALGAEMIRLIRAGQVPQAWTWMFRAAFPAPLRGPSRPLRAAMARAIAPDDPSDALVTLEAEDRFDVGPELGRVTAPTLVIGGGKDPFYSEELFRDTASGVADGRVHLFPRWGHMRACSSTATSHLVLGFMLGGVPAESRPPVHAPVSAATSGPVEAGRGGRGLRR